MSAPIPSPVPQRQGARWPIVPFRVLSVLLLIQVFCQAALAGGFISGKVGLLSMHSLNGGLIILTSFALVAAAFLVWRPGRGPWWPIVFTFLLWPVIGMQIGAGYSRALELHIPLGVTIFGIAACLVFWSFTYRPKWAQR